MVPRAHFTGGDGGDAVRLWGRCVFSARQHSLPGGLHSLGSHPGPHRPLSHHVPRRPSGGGRRRLQFPLTHWSCAGIVVCLCCGPAWYASWLQLTRCMYGRLGVSTAVKVMHVWRAGVWNLQVTCCMHPGPSPGAERTCWHAAWCIEDAVAAVPPKQSVSYTP